MNIDHQHLSQQIEHNLGYHPPTSAEVAERHERVRDAAIGFSERIVLLVDNTRPEMFVALDKIREAMMWANAAIACETEPHVVADGEGPPMDMGVNECAVAERPPVTVDVMAEALTRIGDAIGQIPVAVAESTGLDWMRREIDDLTAAPRA